MTIGIGAHSIEISTWAAREIVICGTVEALVFHRLIQPDWLPGLPGNNSTSQTVLFGDTGPTLYQGNPAGRQFQSPLIRICRRGSKRYQVRIPPTDDQKAVLEQIKRNEQARRDAERSKWVEDQAEATERKREALIKASALTKQLGLIETMEKALQTARQELDLLEQGIRKDPGKQAALEEASDGGEARFRVEDIAMCCGEKVIITGDFSYRRVNSNDGPLIDDDGRRIFYDGGTRLEVSLAEKNISGPPTNYGRRTGRSNISNSFRPTEHHRRAYSDGRKTGFPCPAGAAPFTRGSAKGRVMFEFESELKLLGRLSPGEIRAWRKKKGMHPAVSDLAKKGLYFIKLTFPKHCNYPQKSRSGVIKESVFRLFTLLNTSHDKKNLLLASPYQDVFLTGTASTVLNSVFSYKGWSSHVWPDSLVEHSSFRGAIGMAILTYAIYINKSIERGDYNLAITQISDAFSILILDGEKKYSIKNRENKQKLDEMPALVLRERAKEGAKAKLLKDKKQSEKAFVLSCWRNWRQSPTNYKTKAAFARDMLEKCQSLTSQKKIEDWCREWEKLEPS